MLENLGWFVAVLLGLVGLFILICIPHNVRIWRVRRIYRRLPSQVVSDILALIEKSAANRPSVTFLRLSAKVGNNEETLLESHVGGLPYAESGDEWPQGTPEGEPAKFLLQVRIDEPSLGEQWQGRLIVAFLVFDFEQAVRSYNLGAPDIAYVGGDPVFIQEPLEPPQCNQCGQPMRFLLQFGEVMPALKMADAGIYTVYGCDDHPEQCRGFADMH